MGLGFGIGEALGLGCWVQGLRLGEGLGFGLGDGEGFGLRIWGLGLRVGEALPVWGWEGLG